MAKTLSELRDALTALGISTATEALRGDDRRLVLQQRLEAAQSHVSAALAQSEAPFGTREDSYYVHMSMGELRHALDARALPTDTPGLKGDARRHALVQRLLNAIGTTLNESQTPAACVTTSEASSARDDLDEEEDAQSVTSSSSYSAAGDFLFYDLPSTRSSESLVQIRIKEPGDVHSQPLTGNGGHLKLKKRSNGSARALSFKQNDGSQANEMMLHLPNQGKNLSDSTFDRRQLLMKLRRQLHELRESRHRQVQDKMREAGFMMSLDELSTSIETLEHERQRLLHSFFSHELVTLNVFSRSGSPMELVQEDAIALIEKRQEILKKRIAQTKEAFNITKQQVSSNQDTHRISIENEGRIIQGIRQLEEDLQAQSARDFESDGYSACSGASFASADFPKVESFDSSGSMLTRCRSVPKNMFLQAWNDLDVDQQQQLHHELRSMASFRIRRGRIVISDFTPRSQDPDTHASPRTVPTQADRLGMKALFLEQSNPKNLVEVNRIYQQALGLNLEHATNLGNYALFLYRSCGQKDQAHKYFERAVSADPSNSKNLGYFANFLKRERQEFNRAEKLYQRAIRAAPRDVSVMVNYANLLRKTGQSQKCKQLLEQALRISPNHVQSELQLASVLLELGQPKAADQCYQQLLFRLDSQRDSKKDETLQDHRRARHERAHIYGNYANCLAKLAQWDQAKAMYIKAMDLHPHDRLLTRNL